METHITNLFQSAARPTAATHVALAAPGPTVPKKFSEKRSVSISCCSGNEMKPGQWFRTCLFFLHVFYWRHRKPPLLGTEKIESRTHFDFRFFFLFLDKNQRRSSTASNNSCTQPGLPFLATVFVTRKSCCATFPEVPLIEHFHKKLDAWGWGYVNRREGGTGGAAVGGE